MKLSTKERQIFSIIIASWGIIFVGSGLVMNSTIKPIIKTTYRLDVSEKRISQAQAKTNEIKLKDITIEVNNPISADVKDYLENINNLTDETLNSLKLDTSYVNINQSGKYQYSVTYKKKKYLANIIVKEKELPNVTFTLKTINLKTGDTLSTNPRSYINELISDEVYNNIILDISQVNNQTQGEYSYYIIYKETKYQGIIKITNPGPTIIPPEKGEDKEEQKPEQQET